MSWWSTGKNENLVTKNLFKGVFTTILEGTSIGGDVIWQENIMHSTCTFTNASLNTAGGVALNADLTSSYDTLLVSKTGTAAPTTGTYTAGKKIFKANPTEAGTAGSKYVIFGWICIASGTPGTWVEMRALTGN
jgi:hypothetical protein